MGLDDGGVDRNLGQEQAQLRPARQDIDLRTGHIALDGDADRLQDTAGREVDVVALAEHHPGEILDGEKGLPRRAVAVPGHDHAGHGRRGPGHTHEVGARHGCMKRRFEGEGVGQEAGGPDEGAAWADEDHVALLEAERRRIAVQQEVVEVVGRHGLAATANGDGPIGAVRIDALGLVEIVEDAVVGTADVAARAHHVA